MRCEYALGGIQLKQNASTYCSISHCVTIERMVMNELILLFVY